MGKCKITAIQIDSGTFRHKQAYPGIIQAYSDIFWALCNPSIFRGVVYPEPWHIQNQKHFQNPGIFRTLAYSNSGIFETCSETCQTSTMRRFPKIVNGYNYFHKLQLLSLYKFAAFSASWNKYHEFFLIQVQFLF